MYNNLKNLIALGFTVSGAITAVTAFSDQAKTVQKKGLTLGGALLLIGLGVFAIQRIENAADQTKRFLG